MTWWLQAGEAEPAAHQCVLCGGRCVDRHHLLIARRVVMGWKRRCRKLADHEYNLINLCRLCHKEAHGWKHRYLVARQIVRYGYEHLQNWVGTLPFKIPFHWDMGITSDKEAQRLINQIEGVSNDDMANM